MYIQNLSVQYLFQKDIKHYKIFLQLHGCMRFLFCKLAMTAFVPNDCQQAAAVSCQDNQYCSNLKHELYLEQKLFIYNVFLPVAVYLQFSYDILALFIG